MQTTDLNCCGNTEPTNPKTDVFTRKSKKADHLFGLRNPIPDEVKDSHDLKNIFKNWNLVPYAGSTANSGHSLLAWYLMLAKLSPTNAAAITKKIKFAVGGKAGVMRATDPEYSTGEEVAPVSTQEAKSYIDALKENVTFVGGVGRFHRRIGWQYEATGNSFMELSVSTVNGQTRSSLKAHKTTHCLYVNTKNEPAKIVAVSPVWEDKYMEKNPPRLVPIYPIFAADDNGNLRTMFHLKSGDNDWYGRPSSEGGDIYKYREVQDAIYQVRASATNFTGQLVIEVEDDNPEFAPAIDDKDAQYAGSDGFVERFEKNFTQQADNPQSVVIASRPFGSRPMFVFQVAPNTKESWFKVTGEIAEMKIIRAHNITPRFLGLDVSSGFSTDVYISDYVLNVQPIIEELHNEIMAFTNTALTAVWEIIGRSDLNDFSLRFTPPIQGTIDEFKTAQTAPQQQPQTI